MKFRKYKKSKINPITRGFDSYDFKLGDLLRGERATLGLSLMDIQRALKIKVEIIAAIENCEISEKQESVFIAGYVKSYAKYLNLNPDWVFERFCQEAEYKIPSSISNKKNKIISRSETYKVQRQSINKPTLNKSFFKPTKTYGEIKIRPVVSLFSIFIIIAFFGSGGLFVLNAIQKVQIIEDDNIPVIIEEVGNLRNNFESSHSNSKIKNEYYSSFTPRDGPIVEIDVDQAGVFISKQKNSLNDTSTYELAESIEDDNDIRIFASRPAWVRIYTEGDQILDEKILDISQTMLVPNNINNILLRSGNAGSVFIKIGERTFGPIGEGTGVVKDVLLSKNNILNSFKIVTDQKLLEPLSRIKIITEKTD